MTSSNDSSRVYSPAELKERAIYRRAVEAAIWGMPAVNYELMYREMAQKLGGDFNQILYWSRLLDWKNQTLTPNPDVIYLMPFFDVTGGPVVLEVPPADDGLFNGSIMNCWHAAIEDIGPGGVDKGKGGKYLFLPPNYSESIPDGYIPMQSDTYHGYALVRSVLKSGSAADVATAIAYSKRMKLYPLAQAGKPPSTSYVDASEVIFDSKIPYDHRFFESLARIVQLEPWLERDKLMIDPLKTLGIERGKAFQPDAKTKQIFDQAMLEVHALLDARYEQQTPFYPGGHWFFPASEEFHANIMKGFRISDSFPMDERGCLYTFIFFSAKHVGEAQYYLMVNQDKNGEPLDGKVQYRVRIPANAPITQYWSMTVYDRETHTFLPNARWVGRSSQTPELQQNADGSTDIFFGASAPGAESNWVPTDPKRRFEVLARFYGPKKALFDKSWQLGDIEKV